jgi:hypothetical protein
MILLVLKNEEAACLISNKDLAVLPDSSIELEIVTGLRGPAYKPVYNG